MTAQCEFTISVPGPHEGCAEFAPPEEFQCGRAAVVRVTLDDLHAGMAVESAGGWDSYRAYCIAMDPLEPSLDPGPDPGEANWGVYTLELCQEHYNELEDNPDPDTEVIARELLYEREHILEHEIGHAIGMTQSSAPSTMNGDSNA